jgi:hypothetical protein
LPEERDDGTFSSDGIMQSQKNGYPYGTIIREKNQ